MLLACSSRWWPVGSHHLTPTPQTFLSQSVHGCLLLSRRPPLGLSFALLSLRKEPERRQKTKITTVRRNHRHLSWKIMSWCRKVNNLRYIKNKLSVTNTKKRLTEYIRYTDILIQNISGYSMLYLSIYKYNLRIKSNLTHKNTDIMYVCNSLTVLTLSHIVLTAWHKQHGSIFRQPPEIVTPLLMGVCLCWWVQGERQADDTLHCILRFIPQLSG